MVAVADETTVAVLNNVAIFELGSPRGDLTLSGPDLEDLVFSLSDIVGPDPSSAEPLDREGNARLALGNLASRPSSTAWNTAAPRVSPTRWPSWVAPSPGSSSLLTDTAAVADIGDGECLTVDLLTGGISKAPC